MQLQYVIPMLYPDAMGPNDQGIEPDYTIRDDGTGPFIDRWNEQKLGPRPTQVQLEDGWRRYARNRKAAEFTERGVQEMASAIPDAKNPLRRANERLSEREMIAGMYVMVVDQLFRAIPSPDKRPDIAMARGKLSRAKKAADDALATGRTAEEILALRWEDQ